MVLSRYLAIVLSLYLSALAVAESPTEFQLRNAPLISLLRRKDDVFASNKYGVFRSDLNAQTWKRLDLPETMPPGGWFAGVPAESDVVLYVAADHHWSSSSGYKHGIYASYDQGTTWNLLSENRHYGPVLLLPNRSLFAVDRLHGARHGLLVSDDMGKTWRDITGQSFGEFYRLVPDPDHPGQVCIHAHTIRGYVFQADDERYQWKSFVEWNWHRNRQDAASFFQRRYSTTTVLHMLRATLNNYFEFDFGDRTSMPAIDLSPDKLRFTMPQGTAIDVPLTVRFLEDGELRHLDREERRAQGYPVSEPPAAKPAPTTVTLIDDPMSAGLWGIRVEFNGQRTAKPAEFATALRNAKDRDAQRAAFLEATPWQEIQIDADRPYRRKLDITRLHDFTAPGNYKVQLDYDNDSLGDREKGHWGGSFSSPVFEVKITADD